MDFPVEHALGRIHQVVERHPAVGELPRGLVEQAPRELERVVERRDLLIGELSGLGLHDRGALGRRHGVALLRPAGRRIGSAAAHRERHRDTEDRAQRREQAAVACGLSWHGGHLR